MLTLQDVIWFFLIYSFAGWVFESVLTTANRKMFSNRGLVNGPFCIIYGITAVVITIGLRELSGFWLFFFGAIYATVIEWIGGHLIERYLKERLWDYSGIKFNFDGYVCLPASILWGILGYLVVTWGNGIILGILAWIPAIVENSILLVLLVIIGLDLATSVLSLHGQKGTSVEIFTIHKGNFHKWKVVVFGKKVIGYIKKYVIKRIEKAYPKSHTVEKEGAKDATVFAQGCGFYKVMWLFVVGAFAGDIVETIFCRVTMGVWMSRSSVVWGPFSIVWGLAIALVTVLLYQYRNRDSFFLFVAGTALGGAYEYLCSVFTEIVFGKIFWDYSGMPFNLGGRVNLLYCFFWGIALVVWFKKGYPVISGWIERIPVMVGKVATWGLCVFMILNVLTSALALDRYQKREKGIKAQTTMEQWLDKTYSNEKLDRIYPNGKDV